MHARAGLFMHRSVSRSPCDTIPWRRTPNQQHSTFPYFPRLLALRAGTMHAASERRAAASTHTEAPLAKQAARAGARLSEQLHAARGLGVGVELQQRAQVLQRVLLQRARRAAGARRPHDGLDLVAVDQARQVRVGHGRARQLVAALLLARLLGRACRARAGPLASALFRCTLCTSPFLCRHLLQPTHIWHHRQPAQPRDNEPRAQPSRARTYLSALPQALEILRRLAQALRQAAHQRSRSAARTPTWSRR